MSIDLAATRAVAYGFFGAPSPPPDLDRFRQHWLASGRHLRAPATRPVPDGMVHTAAISGKRELDGAANARQRLLQRITMGWSLVEQQRIDSLGERAYLEQQLDPASIDDGGLDAALEEALPTITMTPLEIATTFGDAFEIPFFELQLATLFRATYSPRQLLERMVVFWSDHFSINLAGDFGPLLKPTDDREVIRRHALGRFGDLLLASATSPAMLDYLTNDSNVKGHPNENYARELMELHTLGVDGGFTEHDVREVSRALTGWSYGGLDAGSAFGQFQFRAADHDTDAKLVLGTPLPAGRGIEDGIDVLAILARHPSTARFVSRKLLRFFWGYEPGDALVARVAQVYLDTDGDIKVVLHRVLSWFQLAVATPKLKRPWHLVISTLRALFADINEPFFVLSSLLAAGHLPFNWGPPNGYPDSNGYWSGSLLPRWSFAASAVEPSESGLGLDVSYLDPALPIEALVETMSLVLRGGTLGDETLATARQFLAAEPVTEKRILEALGLVISSPDFQHY